MTTIWARHAQLPAGMAAKVRITIEGDRIRAVGRGEPQPDDISPVSYTHLTLPTSDLV